MTKIIIPIYISFLLLLEGAALVEPRWLIIFLITGIGLFGVWHSVLKQGGIIVQRKQIYFFLFFIFSLLSLITQRPSSYGIELQIFYFVILLVVLGFAGIESLVRGRLIFLIYLLGYIYCGYSLFINFLAPDFMIPTHGYQFIYSRFNSHNHLGDFLMLPLVVSFYQLFKGRMINSLHIIIFTPFFLTAYSRSAYLGVVLVLGMIVWANRSKILANKWVAGFCISFVLVVSVMFFAITNEAKQVPIFSLVHKNLEEKGDLKYKSIDGRRLQYFEVSLRAFKESPFGVGTGNYIEASKKFLKYKYKTDTAHNIFLEILVENGIVALIFFALFLYEFFKNSSKNVYYYLSIVMLINFQFDYGYRIYTFFLLFIVCLYLSEEGKEMVGR